MAATETKPTTAELITMVKEFISKAEREGRPGDLAYGKGALDALQDQPADYERHGFAEAGGRHYLSGWCKVNGF